jgi:hypothetical protein
MRLRAALLGVFSVLGLVSVGCDCTHGVCDCTGFPHGYGVYCSHLPPVGPPGVVGHGDVVVVPGHGDAPVGVPAGAGASAMPAGPAEAAMPKAHE